MNRVRTLVTAGAVLMLAGVGLSLPQTGQRAAAVPAAAEVGSPPRFDHVVVVMLATHNSLFVLSAR